MSHNKKLKVKQDRNILNAKETHEVEDLHLKYPSHSQQTVAEAVKQHGPDMKKVEAYLDGLGKKR